MERTFISVLYYTHAVRFVSLLWSKSWQNYLQSSFYVCVCVTFRITVNKHIKYCHYLWLPLHSHGTYNAHDYNGDGTNNSNVINITVNNPKSFRMQEIIKRVTESDGVHRRRYSIRKCKHKADRSPKFWAQWPRDNVVHTTYNNGRSLLTPDQVSFFLSWTKFVFVVHIKLYYLISGCYAYTVGNALMIAMSCPQLDDKFLPPLTSPLVQMAERDSVVNTQTTVEIPMMMREWTARNKAILSVETNNPKKTTLYAKYNTALDYD